jgi:molybdopterin molybdotransferase
VLTPGEALEAILAAVRPLEVERADVSELSGRVLAEAIAATEDAPPFDASAMDGWAVRAADLAGASDGAPVALAARGESRAGGRWPEPLGAGTAMRIFTGAPVPEGADAVVMQEVVERDGEGARFRAAPQGGANVRRRGEDHRAGEPLLPAGATLGAGEIALVASQGLASVAVRRAPRVAVLTTGDELRDPGEPARPGSIVDSNGPMVAAAVREAGASPRVLPRAADELAILTALVREGLRADVLVLCGGVSVGDHDLVHRALEEARVEAKFWKVAIKPGKPLTFGIAPGGTPVFGLPGNPVSAWVTFEVFVRPALRKMMGCSRPFRRAIDVALGGSYRHGRGRTELARARLSSDGSRAVAHLHPRQGSASIASIAGADALVVLPADREAFSAGDVVRALVLGGPGSDEAPFR